MNALERLEAEEGRHLLEPEVWEAPWRLSPDELTAHGAVDPRPACRTPDEMEDDL